MPLSADSLAAVRGFIDNEILTDTGDLLEQLATDTLPGSHMARDGHYPVKYSGIKCRYAPTDEFDQPNVAGSSKVINLFTLDELRVLPGQEILFGWLFRLTTAGHPLAGQLWMVQGNSDPLSGISGQQLYQRLYIKRQTETQASV